MRQRLGLALALLGDPGVVLLDEPANGLDPEGIQWVRAFLKALANQGRTIFVSSHLLAEMALMADDLVVIGRGRLIAQTTVEGSWPRAPRAGWWCARPEADRLAALLTTGRRAGRAGGRCPPRLRAGRRRDRRSWPSATTSSCTSWPLTPGSLEEAFLQATADAQEFRAAPAPAPVAAAGQLPAAAGDRRRAAAAPAAGVDASAAAAGAAGGA